MGSIMKVHHLARGLAWPSPPPEAAAYDQQSTSLTLGCKRLRPLAPKLSDASSPTATCTSESHAPSFDLKSFIKSEGGPQKLLSSGEDHRRDPSQDESGSHPGGTRWNPTQEQIQILEMLYRGGMRTPNSQQIEQITAKLGKFGRIEGKNVFYWFQNHKARERQKLKRNSPVATTTPLISSSVVTLDAMLGVGAKDEKEGGGNKRKCISWGFESLEIETKLLSNQEEDDGTLELFPLRPERK